MSKFKVGDTVVIARGTFGGWSNFKAKVIEGGFQDKTYLEPLSDRPDNHGRNKFYWPTDDLDLANPHRTYTEAEVIALIDKGAKQEGLCADGVNRFLAENGLTRSARTYRVTVELTGTPDQCPTAEDIEARFPGSLNPSNITIDEV